ncbi:sucrose-6-phosphate hydrolase [Enterococcus faecalis 13-SD-W-01]|nr:sucrose-6-phosphate hydrolase [Enterococcus faecalis 13-SD-W-01]
MPLKTTWTKEERYRPYEKWNPNHLRSLEKAAERSLWRLGYHIQPQTGLLNDPNGFSYFDHKWHLFYQAYPMGPIHGLKSWYHLTSENLIDWKNEGIKLFPDSKYDSHGVYSGSALAFKDQLFLSYTGNVRDENWERHAYQLGAWMDKNGVISKQKEPLIHQPPKGYTAEFRDPQILPFEEGYLMIIGAQNKEMEGKILTYFSKDLSNWECLGELAFAEEKMGFMVECPNLLFTENCALLLFCPQGLDQTICPYENIYPNMYVIGECYDKEKNTLIAPSPLKNLDEGFDVYATQAFHAPDGRLLAISWLGLPEISYPTDQEGWAHCLSLVKELTIKDNRLYQTPAAETKELRTGKAVSLEKELKDFYDSRDNQYELNITFSETASGTLTLFAEEGKNNGLVISFDTPRGTMKIDRSQAGTPFAEAFGLTREFTIGAKPLTLQIFVDCSVVEIFINHGEQTASLRAFPTKKQTGIVMDSDRTPEVNLWQLRKMDKKG